MNLADIAFVVAAVVVAAGLVVWRERVKTLARSTAGYYGEVQAEIRKVTWPDRQQLRSMTGVIMLFVFIVMLLIGLMDIILQAIFTNWLPRWFG